jgi:hypothetical protein
MQGSVSQFTSPSMYQVLVLNLHCDYAHYVRRLDCYLNDDPADPTGDLPTADRGRSVSVVIDVSSFDHMELELCSGPAILVVIGGDTVLCVETVRCSLGAG